MAVDAIEIRAAPEPSAARSTAAGPRGAPLMAGHGQGVSRWRPFDRLRLNMRRPERVRERARNPWVRARLRFFGW